MEILEIQQINSDSDRNSTRNSIMCPRKLIKHPIYYVGLIVLFVPSALCNPDWSHRLTFDEIYNDTNYAHLRYTPRPYDAPVQGSSSRGVSLDVLAENHLEYKAHRASETKDIVLVGFSHNPFRSSVLEEEYHNGDENLHPNAIESKSENRGKRGVFQLYNVVKCATGCDPKSYLNYGCYCGFLGAGPAVDGIDRCCQRHDRCYDSACPFQTLVYIQPYYWKCKRRTPLCLRNRSINRCSDNLCKCDVEFARCLQRYRCPRSRPSCPNDSVRFFRNLFLWK